MARRVGPGSFFSGQSQQLLATDHERLAGQLVDQLTQGQGPYRHADGGVPRSTSAAQLLADQFGQESHGNVDSEAFRTLLAVVLEKGPRSSNEVPSSTPTVVDMDLTYQLVYVIAQAGLSLSSPDQRLVQSLQAIGIALQQSPAVVGHSVQLDANKPVQLMTWLWPDLVKLLQADLSADATSAIHELISQLFDLDRRVQAADLRPRHVRITITGYCEEVLRSLERNLGSRKETVGLVAILDAACQFACSSEEAALLQWCVRSFLRLWHCARCDIVAKSARHVLALLVRAESMGTTPALRSSIALIRPDVLVHLLPTNSETKLMEYQLSRAYEDCRDDANVRLVALASLLPELQRDRRRFSDINVSLWWHEVRADAQNSLTRLLTTGVDSGDRIMVPFPEVGLQIPQKEKTTFNLRPDSHESVQACVRVYSDLSEKQRCAVLQELSRAAHLSDPTCDDDHPSGGDVQPFVWQLFNKLATMCESRKLLVATLHAMSVFLAHCRPSDFPNLAKSRLGQLCLNGLEDSGRAVRIAAARVLPCFLRQHGAIHEVNCQYAFEYLHKFSEQALPSRQETCILTWSSIARVLGEGKEMNLALSKMVQYLGSTNVFLSALAYDESHANHSPFTAMKLFAPYWRSIAVSAVQDLQRRPQIVQQLSELLAIQVKEFLVLTQTYTVPYFVLRKKHDILQRIAEACGQSIMTVCREHANMAGILAGILLQCEGDVEGLVVGLLSVASPEFAHIDYAELLKSEPQATVAELLKNASDTHLEDQPKTIAAIRLLAEVIAPKITSSRASRKADAIGPFFQSHVLGIMAQLADTINDGRGPQPVLEKQRCLNAIKFMIKIGNVHIANGLPQICACLRSAMESSDLLEAAFEAWSLMMTSLDDVVPLLGATFALISQSWPNLPLKLQGLAYDMVGQLLKKHDEAIVEVVHTLPSLAQIPMMTKYEKNLQVLRDRVGIKQRIEAFIARVRSENALVVGKALQELAEFLRQQQSYIHEQATGDAPDPIFSNLCRAILDATVGLGQTSLQIADLCARCLGELGCVDPTRVEASREFKTILILSNFCSEDEIKDFVVFLLEHVLVKAFLAATNSRSQGFLAFAMQELLAIGDLNPSTRDQRWNKMPESVRTILTPFLDSKYFVTAGVNQAPVQYPLYQSGMTHAHWLRMLAFDLLKRTQGETAVANLFSVLSRIIRFQDLSIARFILPYCTLNGLISEDAGCGDLVSREMLNILTVKLDPQNRDVILACSQTLFEVLDYLSRWMQEKRKERDNLQNSGRGSRAPPHARVEQVMLQISSVDSILTMIPANVIAARAVECKSYARALIHWEQHIRQDRQKQRDLGQDVDLDAHLQRLQTIYSQIDEPDGMEGISAHLQIVNVDQQILEHRKAGRWSATQSWSELQLHEQPHNRQAQHDLLTSLRECGQYDVLLNQVSVWEPDASALVQALPFAVEAAWMSGRWHDLYHFLDLSPASHDFNVQIGRVLRSMQEHPIHVSGLLRQLRASQIRELSSTNTASLQDCHDILLRFHVLNEVEAVHSNGNMSLLNRRLDLIGPFFANKHYILGVRRAAMRLMRHADLDIASCWLTSAKLARQSNAMHLAFRAVLQALQLGDASATIEHSRLLWRVGEHRKAIQGLQAAIAANAFRSHDSLALEPSIVSADAGQQNVLKAKAHLLLAKWTDRAGQQQSDLIIAQYKEAIRCHNRWERGHYYLGKHYNKLLESEKAKPHAKQAVSYITGETAKLVVENYCRAICFGAKYIYQILPRILTLWLDLGLEADAPLDARYVGDDDYRSRLMVSRRKMLGLCNAAVKRYTERLPPFVFYTALPQTVARICHPNQLVYGLLIEIVAKVVNGHAPQALWTLLAMVKSSSKDRAARGAACMARVHENAKLNKNDPKGIELKAMMAQGQKLSGQLLAACERDLPPKVSHVSLAKDLGFNHKTAASKLAVPFQAGLTALLPVGEGVNMRNHRAFSTNDYVQIAGFQDDVTVLNSLQRPRKLSLRGSDGHVYALLCKPKDDLRKDQRLMEFNAMINRALKRDPESSRRRLYIKTYAVTPLNEECGLIEWVDQLKTLREILLGSYKQKNVHIDYVGIRSLMNEAIATPSKLHIFNDKVLRQFPPVFHEWFVDLFPEPGSWFAARLRYSRSCAVMSIVGHVLGLGDRHGENILFEESNGGTFHVDFNCLFDKGLTFEKPELVPFRLTHNMVDAFGAYGYEGPFRKCCELTDNILRQHEDTLMTILETFLYDPTTDFIGKKKKRETIVPDTPEGVLESVRNKLRGLLPGESVPLSVEGYVDALIKQATDPFRLASMYIGWCPFF